MSNKDDKEIFLWQDELIIPLLTGLKIAEGTAEYATFSANPISISSNEFSASGIPFFSPVYPSDEIRCSCCQIELESRDQLIKHYSEDWHKYNIKRTIEKLQPKTLLQYESLDDPEDEENESNSSSESGDEDDLSEEEQEQYRRTPRIYFKNIDGITLSIYKTILLPPKTLGNSELELVTRGHCCYKKLNWVIILIAGGHFAATVFKGPNIIEHKTFHSYTIRAGQGGSQSSYDNRKGRQANSAGASLRRYNEKTFAQHVQNILIEWKNYIEKCDLIFHRSPLNCRHILFGGQNPILKKHDSRLRTIPIPTKRPTFNETKHVHYELSKVIVYGFGKGHKKRIFADLEEFKLESQRNKKIPQRPPIVKRKVEEKVQEVLELKEIPEAEEESLEEPIEEELICKLEEIDFSGLEEYGYVQTLHSENEDETPGDITLPLEVKNTVFNACIKGNIPLLESITKCCSPGFVDVDDVVPASVREFLINNQGKINILETLFGPHKKTILHIASENCKNDMIWWLMEQGCDPAVEDFKNRLPYSVAPNKDVRNHFRRFMNQYPDKFDYKKAKIPSPLSQQQENQKQKKQLDKKMAQKKAKKIKEAEINKRKEDIAKEKLEQKRFSNLSEREKRALAAERRYIGNTINGSMVRQLCQFCNKDMTGEVPFSFNNQNFCSTSCVTQQRKRNKS